MVTVGQPLRVHERPPVRARWRNAVPVRAIRRRLARRQADEVLDDVHPLTPARWSPTGAQLAVAAGQECKRWGIYVVSPAAPGQAHRRTNLCRFEGGPGPDTLIGTAYSDTMRGLGDNDRMLGGEGNDRIEGNGGTDTISAGTGNNAVFGGPGNDTITAGDGADRIEARDGFRDVIDCGVGNDAAEVDRLDVLRNCEHVLRP
jgi:hypothetical protein